MTRTPISYQDRIKLLESALRKERELADGLAKALRDFVDTSSPASKGLTLYAGQDALTVYRKSRKGKV